MQINPTVEYMRIARWLVKVATKQLTPEKFVQRLGSFLNKHHKIKVNLLRNTVLSKNDFTIGAEYDVLRDEEGKKPIILTLIINKKPNSPWKITEELAQRINIELVEALVHEYQHMYQYRSRGFMLNRSYHSAATGLDLRADQEYLGCRDEIDAYAANIAAKFYLTDQNIINPAEPVSLDLGSYYATFGKDHPVVKLLLKKIVKNLDKLRSQPL